MIRQHLDATPTSAERAIMSSLRLAKHGVETARHRTVWHEAVPVHGPLIHFLQEWPELGLVWRRQIEHFSAPMAGTA